MRTRVGLAVTFCLAALAGGQGVWSHEGNRPVSPISGIGRIFEANHAGYGYIMQGGTENSEAGGDDRANFMCRDSDLRTYAGRACNSARRPTTENARQLASSIFRPIFLEKLGAKVFEYLTLQMASLTTTRPVPVTRPSCLDRPGPLPSALPSTVPTAAEIRRMPARTSAQRAARNLAVKFRAVSESYNSDRVVSALLLHDQLVRAERDYCPGRDQDGRLKCMDIRSQRGRVRNAFPILGVSDAAETVPLHHLRDKVLRLLGSHNAPSIITSEADLIARGRTQVYQPAINDDFGMPRLESAFSAAAGEARSGTKVCTDPRDKTTCTRQPAEARLASALTALNDEIASMNTGRQRLINAEIAAMCADFSAEAVARKYPQVARQLLQEESGRELALSKAFLCESGVAEDIQRDDRNSCAGVTRNPDGSVSVSRGAYDFPFRSSTGYKVTKNARGEYSVSMTINFNRAVDSSSTPPTPAISQEDFDRSTAAWVADATSWYSRAGATASPRVRFAISAGNGTTPPVMNVSDCYNRTLAPAMRNNCAAVAAAGGNWQDSGNLTGTSTDGTVHHEFGHLMGLDDEYNRDYYPMNLLGEHDSVMNGSNDRDRLYPRHIQQIIRPAQRCQSL